MDDLSGVLESVVIRLYSILRTTLQSPGGIMLGKKKPALTRGQMEADISAFASRFEKEHMGRGPLETRTAVMGDLVVVRHKGLISRAEAVAAAAASENVRAIKLARSAVLEASADPLCAHVKMVPRRRVVSMHADLSTVTGERIIVFVLESAPEIS